MHLRSRARFGGVSVSANSTKFSPVWATNHDKKQRNNMNKVSEETMTFLKARARDCRHFETMLGAAEGKGIGRGQAIMLFKELAPDAYNRWMAGERDHHDAERKQDFYAKRGSLRANVTG